MDYRILGRTGLRVSELCLGSMQFGWTADEEISTQILNNAWQAGINFIDTADLTFKPTVSICATYSVGQFHWD